MFRFKERPRGAEAQGHEIQSTECRAQSAEHRAQELRAQGSERGWEGFGTWTISQINLNSLQTLNSTLKL